MNDTPNGSLSINVQVKSESSVELVDQVRYGSLPVRPRCAFGGSNCFGLAFHHARRELVHEPRGNATSNSAPNGIPDQRRQFDHSGKDAERLAPH